MRVLSKPQVSEKEVLLKGLVELCQSPSTGLKSTFTRDRVASIQEAIQECLNRGFSHRTIARRLAQDGFGRCADTIRREILRQFDGNKIKAKGEDRVTHRKTRVTTPSQTRVTTPSPIPAWTPSHKHAGFREDPV